MSDYLRRVTAAGLLGRKSGRGCYDYTNQSGKPESGARR
jgi:3-hydroxyacyl-CoA dehydrogenase